MSKVKVLTGNSGAGKTTIANILRGRGYDVLDVDKLTHQIIWENKEIIDKMYFNGALTDFIDNDKPLEFRRTIGAIIFNPVNIEVKTKYFDYIGGLTKKAIETRVNLVPEIIIDAPTFFELYGLKKHDEYQVYTVVCDATTRLARCIARETDVDATYLARRLTAQISEADKVKFSDILINNNDTVSLESLVTTVDSMFPFVKEEEFTTTDRDYWIGVSDRCKELAEKAGLKVEKSTDE